MKNRKIRLLIGRIISLLPSGRVRIFFYRKIFGYHISQSVIGWKTLIVVDGADLTECAVGGNNEFIGPMNLVLKKGASVGEGNTFHCGWWTREERFQASDYKRFFQMGENTRIGLNHHFDVAGSFVLGDRSWIGGQGSQFWTHGVGAIDRNINIGEHCYIGSAVRFAPGASIGNNTLVGLGSVVTKKFDRFKNVVIAGQPARVVKENYDWQTQKYIEK